jgi:histidinol-phosphate aminotransferase
MSHQYERVEVEGEGLRLHLNENTGGCSPRVMDALRAMTATDLAFYPDYRSVHLATARALGVAEDRLILTNGMDEGILAAAIAYLRPSVDDPTTTVATFAPEAIVVEPAFGMYADAVEAAGGRMVTVLPAEDLSVPLDSTLAAITPATRLVFLTSPGNPSGRLVPVETITTIASRLPAHAVLFLDEAYADFTDGSFLPVLEHWPNVVIGRTFAKAYGLAGVRAGAVIGGVETVAKLARVVPPYSLNAIAARVLPDALADESYVRGYREEVRVSRELMYEACRRLGLEFVPSEANFVLVRAGDRLPALVAGLSARGIFVRDRSWQPGCTGCMRVTTGLVAHTRACIAAMEEVLCAAR